MIFQFLCQKTFNLVFAFLCFSESHLVLLLYLTSLNKGSKNLSITRRALMYMLLGVVAFWGHTISTNRMAPKI